MIIILITTLVWSCSDQPKKVEPTNNINSESIFNESSGSSGHGSNSKVSSEVIGKINKVVVQEFLPTQKYVYMRVINAGTNEEYWIATTKMEVNVGDAFYYKTALLKENFHSQEYDRHFDKLYLVDNIVPSNHGSEHEMKGGVAEVSTTQLKPVEGSIGIASLVKDPVKYAGQTVQVTAVCTKVNSGIMKRNWVHLKDNSGTEYDFVATTQEDVKVGELVTMRGRLSTDKDFGAGYRYVVILEDCKVVR